MGLAFLIWSAQGPDLLQVQAGDQSYLPMPLVASLDTVPVTGRELDLDIRTLGSGTLELHVRTLGSGTPELYVRTLGSGTLELHVSPCNVLLIKKCLGNRVSHTQEAKRQKAAHSESFAPRLQSKSAEELLSNSAVCQVLTNKRIQGGGDGHLLPQSSSFVRASKGGGAVGTNYVCWACQDFQPNVCWTGPKSGQF